MIVIHDICEIYASQKYSTITMVAADCMQSINASICFAALLLNK